MLNLEPNEKIIMEVRKHWLVMLMDTIVLVGSFILPIYLYKLLAWFFQFELSQYAEDHLMLLYIIWLISAWILYFIRWTDYFLDVWVITDKRIIDNEQVGLWKRDIASLRFDMIEDIKVEVAGVIRTFLKIGDIHIQTAGTEREFVLKSAAQAEEVKRLIMSMHNKKLDEVKTVQFAQPAPASGGTAASAPAPTAQ